ncbi:MAG: hypothetical protein C4305_06170 [Thermoleophilia bacterium]
MGGVRAEGGRAGGGGPAGGVGRAARGPSISGRLKCVERLETLLRHAFPDAAELRVVDRMGTGDHLHVTVVSPRFRGLSLVDQHKLVYEALADGTIHELRITTRES